jgi:hypothetical protein
MKINNLRLFFIILFILTFTIGLIFGIYLNLEKNVEIVKTYFDMSSFKLDLSSVNGFYHYDGYFCVVTQNRTAKDITSTTIHELTHYYIDEDYKHFCGG